MNLFKRKFLDLPPIEHPKVINFSTPRSGSTKLLNLFHATGDLLDLSMVMVKSHPGSYNTCDLDFSTIDQRTIIICSQRKILEQVASFTRTILNKHKSFSDYIFVYSINYIITQKIWEIKILEKALTNSVNVYFIDYSYLIKSSAIDLIRNIACFYIKALGLNLTESNLSRLLNDTMRIEGLTDEYGLSFKSARKIQSQFEKDFKKFDHKTQIHGQHILDLGDNWLEDFLSRREIQGYLYYANLIDKKHQLKLKNLLLKKRKAISISYLNTVDISNLNT